MPFRSCNSSAGAGAGALAAAETDEDDDDEDEPAILDTLPLLLLPLLLLDDDDDDDDDEGGREAGFFFSDPPPLKVNFPVTTFLYGAAAPAAPEDMESNYEMVHVCAILLPRSEVRMQALIEKY